MGLTINGIKQYLISAGTAILGKVGIDQTTDGTTNKVQARNATADNFAVNANVQMADADVSASNPLATKDIATPAAPTIYNVTMTTLNTEYSQALPANCKKFAMKVQLGTGSYKYRVAFVTGKVATPVAPYLQYNDDVEYFEEGLNYATSTLYFASTTSGLVMQIIAWV